MTTAADELQTALHTIGKRSIGSRAFVDLRPMSKTIEILSAINDRPVQISKQPIEEALHMYMACGQIETPRQAKYLCYGICSSIVQHGKKIKLITNQDKLTTLLSYVEKFTDRPQRFQRYYRGLLDSYFHFSLEHGHESKENGREQLRQFLESKLSLINKEGINPQWVTELNRNSNLLGKRPTKKYSEIFAVEGSDPFMDVCDKVQIRETTWLQKDYINEKVKAIAAIDDHGFKSKITYLLGLIEQNLASQNTNLACILDRYAQCSDPSIHTDLRDKAVGLWKNPWIEANKAQWGLVEDTTREMVVGWLKKHLIGAFFEYLSADGSNNSRRVNMWREYHAEIEDMYFALGTNAQKDNSRSMQDMKRKMVGRTLTLEGVSNTNNAFIMIFQKHVIVEFGEHGNACYIYERGAYLPFKLQGQVIGDSSQLKNDSSAAYVNKLRHRDKISETWEETFKDYLKSLGIRIKAHTPRAANPPIHRPIPRPPVEDNPGLRLPANKKAEINVADEQLIASLPLRKEFRLKLEELVSGTGGRIKRKLNSANGVWFYPKSLLTHEQKRQIEELGFQWSSMVQGFSKEDFNDEITIKIENKQLDEEGGFDCNVLKDVQLPPHIKNPLKDLFKSHALTINDLRHKGGSLWVSGNETNIPQQVKHELERLGFRWSAKREEFYLPV